MAILGEKSLRTRRFLIPAEEAGAAEVNQCNYFQSIYYK